MFACIAQFKSVPSRCGPDDQLIEPTLNSISHPATVSTFVLRYRAFIVAGLGTQWVKYILYVEILLFDVISHQLVSRIGRQALIPKFFKINSNRTLNACLQGPQICLIFRADVFMYQHIVLSENLYRSRPLYTLQKKNTKELKNSCPSHPFSKSFGAKNKPTHFSFKPKNRSISCPATTRIFEVPV